jgi:phosphonate transport system substrate-binding protein
MQYMMQRRRFVLIGLGVAGTGLLACTSAAPSPPTAAPAPPTAAPTAAPKPTTPPAQPPTAVAAPTPAAQPAAPTTAPAQAAGDLNDKGWPRSIEKLSMGFIPLEDQVQQRNQLKPLVDYLNSQLGVPVDVAITTSYAALVEAQRNDQVVLGYYGPLSFLFAEQRFGAVPILVDSPDGKTVGHYNSMLLAGKDSPVKAVADIKGKDFSFVDPASTSGNLFPRVMLIQAGIDPSKDIKGRYAGNHQNSILAIAKGQVPAGASNNLSVDSAVDKGQIQRSDLVVLQTSPDIPNGPFAVSPKLDQRAVDKLVKSMTGFTDAATLKAMELVGPLIPVKASEYDFVRQAAKTINLEFDDKGNPKPVGE